RFEQLFDFREMCAFRNSVFCRGGDVDRRFDAQRLSGLWAGGDVRAIDPSPDAPDSFSFRLSAGAEITTKNQKVARFLAGVAAALPTDISLDSVAADPELAAQVMRLFFRGVVYICNASLPVASTLGERPVASPLARFQAEQGESDVTTLRHRSVTLK